VLGVALTHTLTTRGLTMIRMMAAVRDALVVLAFVAGPPAGLLAVAGSPIPDALPSAAALHAWLDDPLHPRFAAGTAITVGWLLWAGGTATIVTCLTARFRAARPRWHRATAWLPPPMQTLAATVVGAAAFTSATATPAVALAAPTDNHSDTGSTVPAATMAPSAKIDRDPAPATQDRAGTADQRPRRTAPDSPSIHRVRRGDTLSGIAARRLGDADRWPEIFALNRGTRFPVGGTVTDPDLIRPRWVLKLPTGHATPPPQQHRKPAPHAGNPPNPEYPRPDSATASAPHPSAPPASACSADPCQPTAPPASTAGHANPGFGSASTDAEPAGTRPELSDDDWMAVAGGFIGAGLAAGLVYSAGMVWKRRRHRYQPVRVAPATAEGAGPPAPLAALTRLRRGVRRSAFELADAGGRVEPTVREYLTDPAAADLPPVGPTGADLAGLGPLPVTGGVGLDGPAAQAATRGLLVAALTSGIPDDPHAQTRVVITAAVLADVLGDRAADRPPTPRLTVAATFADAIATLEEEVIRRSRILADHDAADVAALREHTPLAEPLPHLLLVADVPDDSWHARLSTAMRLGTAVDIGAVLIGTWPHLTLTVAADGSTRGGDGHRLAVLDAAATAELLDMLAEAHGETLTSPAAPAAGRPRQTDPPLDRQPPHPIAAPVPDEPPQPAPVDRRVSARVLGRPALLDADGAPVRGLRAKSLELFVYLVAHRNGATLNSIMEALWPDVSVSRATERLSTCVANLRTTIRSLARTGTDRPDRTLEPVINTGGHYHLDPNLLTVDWWTVLDACTAVAAATDHGTRLTHLRTAINAIQGHGLADDMPYDWIDTDREHVRRRLITVYAEAASLLADSDPRTSRAYSDIACALDPLSDELARRAMRAAARLGDADGVRTRLARLRRDLDDAGIDMDADTERLAADLRHDLSSTRPPTPPSAGEADAAINHSTSHQGVRTRYHADSSHVEAAARPSTGVQP
jgi:DNA-binding SARP family transcriptional activator